MSFSKNDLDIIKSKISIRSELEKKNKLVRKGKDYWCCCPFHEEKTPSCKINDDSSSYYCFGCGAKGDIFSLYTDLYNYNFIDAVKELSQRAGVQINFENTKKNKQENKIEDIINISSLWFQENLNHSAADICNKYLKKRKLTKETINKFKLGFSYNSDLSLYEYLKKKSFTDEELLKSNVIKLDKNRKIRDYFYRRLIFPIMNIQGRVIGFGGRALDNSMPKYINSPESDLFKKRYLLYNLNLAKNSARKKNNLLICEGYMDVISLSQNGVSSVVAPLGTALTEDQLNLSWMHSSKPTIMFDGDSAGIRASYKSAIMSLPLLSPKKLLQFITLPSNFDPDTYINAVSLKKFISKLRTPEPITEFIINQSIKTVALEKVDEKISYDNYLDELLATIQDKKIQYFYKNEFKSLFFKKIREINNNKTSKKILPNQLDNNLSKKQTLSFFAAGINHISVRKDILEKVLTTELINKQQQELAVKLIKIDTINLKKDEILIKFSNSEFNTIIEKALSINIYDLFPYSSPKFDPNKALEEVIKSLNNLNTRLSNLKKINKSLDTFVNDSNHLNWSELQSINTEIVEED
jgi:DNA primase